MVGVDERRLRADAESAAESIKARNQAQWRLAQAVGPYLGTACGGLASTDIGIERLLPD